MRLLTLSIVASIILSLCLHLIDRPLRTPPAPLGIVSFELAGTWPSARSILHSWDERARLHAALSLGLDYLFMVTYGLAVSLGCLWVADQRTTQLLKNRPGDDPSDSSAFPRWGSISDTVRVRCCLSTGAAAAFLDAVENAALILVLFGAEEGDALLPWPFVALVCASSKFAILALTVAYVAVGAATVATTVPGKRTSGFTDNRRKGGHAE